MFTNTRDIKKEVAGFNLLFNHLTTEFNLGSTNNQANL